MQGDDDKTIEALRDGILRAAAPQCIVLFGSRARGDATQDSDYDLLVVETSDFPTTQARRSELRRIQASLKEARVPADVLLVSCGEVAKWRHSVNHVIARSLQEGLVLHGSL